MSRSRRKTWIISNCGGRGARSEKDDKKRANRKFRKISKHLVSNGDEPLYNMTEISDIWTWGKDGKSRFKDPKYVRK